MQGVYKDVIQDWSHELEPASKALYVLLLSFVGQSSPQPFPRLSTLAKIMGVCRQTVQRHLQFLESAGLIERHQRRQVIDGRLVWGSNSYTIHDQFPEQRKSAIRNPKKPARSAVNFTDYGKADYGKADYGKLNCIRITQMKGEEEGQRPSSKRLKENPPPIPQEKSGRPKASPSIPDGGSGASDLKRPSASEPGPAALPDTPAPNMAKMTEAAKKDGSVFLKGYANLVRLIKGHTLHLNGEDLSQAQTFFLEHPDWLIHDVLYIAFLGMVRSERQPRPKTGVDPFFYCRRADSPHKFLGINRCGDSWIMEAARELDYNRDLDADQINAKIEDYFAPDAEADAVPG